MAEFTAFRLFGGISLESGADPSSWDQGNLSVGHNQWQHFQVGELPPPHFTYFSGWIGMFTGGLDFDPWPLDPRPPAVQSAHRPDARPFHHSRQALGRARPRSAGGGGRGGAGGALKDTRGQKNGYGLGRGGNGASMLGVGVVVLNIFRKGQISHRGGRGGRNMSQSMVCKDSAQGEPVGLKGHKSATYQLAVGPSIFLPIAPPQSQWGLATNKAYKGLIGFLFWGPLWGAPDNHGIYDWNRIMQLSKVQGEQ